MVDEIRAFDRAFDVVVIDDGSDDATVARSPPRTVRPSSRCRSTSASAAPCRRASSTRSSTATSSPCASTATASTIPPSSEAPRRRFDRGEADIVAGSRFADGARAYRPPLARRIGITWFARLVSLLTRQRVTDTTSGFQALNRKGIALFAGDYPNDYPEVEATVLVFKHRLRLAEVPVQMREREHGAVVDHLPALVYYMLKVTLALFVAIFRTVRRSRRRRCTARDARSRSRSPRRSRRFCSSSSCSS